MYIGFVIHHVTRKVIEATAVAVGVGLCTAAGRKAARVVWASAKAATMAAYQEATRTNTV